MEERERLTFLGKHYDRLKNLRFAPVYILFAAVPWMDSSVVNVPAVLIALGICVAWYLLLNRYYKQRYGQVEGKYDRGNIRFGNLPFVLVAIFVLYFIVRGQHIPVGTYLLLIPAGMFAEGFSYSKLALRRFYYIVASMVSVLVVLTMIISNLPRHGFFLFYGATFLGVAMLMLSILDHLLLVSAFRYSSQEINA